MKNLTQNLKLVFDFDSTFIKLETLEVVAQIYLTGNPNSDNIQTEIKRITNLGMEGKISFKESLTSRMKLVELTRKNIDESIQIIKKNISDSFIRNKQFFLDNGHNIYILSGGFTQIIEPIVREFNIANENIIANELVFKNDEVIDVRSDLGLLEPKGKPNAIRNKKLNGNIVMIGDGFTDLEVKLEGAADKFIAYCENIKRDTILEQADLVAYKLEDVFNFLQL